MSENVIQSSFAAGELAPSIFARTDLAAYHQGAATMRNFFVDYRSGASTRTGTKFVIQAFKSATAVRLIPFTYSVITTYIVEFGDRYVRFINNGGAVLEAGFVISGLTSANPAVATVVGNNFVNGDWVFITGVVGAPQFNNRYYSVTVVGASVTLSDVNGNPINAASFGTYVSGGTMSRVYTLTSPYAAADLALLKFTQSASVMTITHPSYPITTLTFIAPTNWVFTTVVIGTTVVAPTGLAGVASAAGTANYSYVVTAVDGNGQESVVSAAAAVPNAVNITSTAGTIALTWNPVVGAVSYNVYKAELSVGSAVPANQAYGFIQNVTGTSFNDTNMVPDFTVTPPIPNNPFAGGTNNPGCNCYFQQRAYYAGSNANPITFYGSQPGNFNNFNISDPTQDDDAITGPLVSLQVNAIKNMLPMPGGLIFLTAKGAWSLSSGSSGNATAAVTPTNATATPQAYNGASDVPPIVVNYDILYVQAKGAIVRDLSYNIYAAIYTGNDISIRSNHLFFGRQIIQWAYAEEPFKVIWAVRDDGILLSLTFVKEQEIYGWARHDSLGLFQSVASVTEGQVDAVYFVVKRYIQGRWVQYIERQMERTFAYGAEDAWNVDAGLQSSLPTPNATLTASAASGNATFSADAPEFSAGSIGSVIRMGGGIAAITSFISTTQVVGQLTQNITQTLPTDPANTPLPAAPGTWSLTAPSTVFFGFDYLVGQTVSVLADGGVVGQQVVAVDGSITLPQPATKVTAGLGYQAQLQTMPLDTGEPTIQGKRKKIAALNLKLASTRGLKAGRTFSTLVPIKEMRPAIPLGTAIPLVTGDERVIMDPLWDVPGQICLQVDDPLPASVLGVIPEIIIGDTVK